MGISLANLGDYDASARYYVRALALNPRASSGAQHPTPPGVSRFKVGSKLGRCAEGGAWGDAPACSLHAAAVRRHGAQRGSARLRLSVPLAVPSPPAVWGYLRTSLTCAARQDLLSAADAEDLPALQRELPLE